MNKTELIEKYVNKYLEEDEKWNYIIAILRKMNTIKDPKELRNELEKSLLEVTKADECKFFLKEVDKKEWQISVPIVYNDINGVIALKSKNENFYKENIRQIQVIAENIGLMLENITLIEDLKERNRFKMEFLAGISHEFKTPLNSIMGFAEVLKQKCDEPDSYKYLCNIAQSSKYLITLIQDVLDVTRSQYKPLELYYEVFKPKDVILEILPTFEELLKEKNINLTYTLLDITVNADLKRFKQLIYNFVSNSIKFNRNDGKINIVNYVDEGKYVFEITDTGDGISKKDYCKIFEFFSQVNADRLKRQVGSGVGLALCKTIVNAHKGKISFKSRKGSGSTFWFAI